MAPGVLQGAAGGVEPSPLLIDQDGRVTYAPDWVQFDVDWLYQAAQARAATVVGLDVVIHAVNGDFHYRHEADLPHTNSVLMRRVDV